MKLTKTVNIFNLKKREIRCIANEHDYLGDGNKIVEPALEIGKIYTFIHGRARAYGNMVSLQELPSRFGFQAYLFEELEPYDEEAYLQKSRKWLLDMLQKSQEESERRRIYSAQETEQLMEKISRHERFDPHYTEGHDPGAAYWIYPVKVEDADRIQDVEEFSDWEISIPNTYFDALLTDFFVDGINPDLSINAHRYCTDYVPEREPIFGFAWDLYENFYTREDMDRIFQRMEAAADTLRSGHMDQFPSKQKNRLREIFARVAEDASELTYTDAMHLTAQFYDTLRLRLYKMLTDCTMTDIFSVMAP